MSMLVRIHAGCISFHIIPCTSSKSCPPSSPRDFTLAQFLSLRHHWTTLQDEEEESGREQGLTRTHPSQSRQTTKTRTHRGRWSTPNTWDPQTRPADACLGRPAQIPRTWRFGWDTLDHRASCWSKQLLCCNQALPQHAPTLLWSSPWIPREGCH